MGSKLAGCWRMIRRTLLLGGLLRADGSAILGDMSQSILRNSQVQRAFVSCSGFSADVGWLEKDLQETPMKSLMLQSAKQTIALVDSSKAQTRGLMPFATLDQIAFFVTDAKMPSEIIEQIRYTNTDVIVCDEHPMVGATFVGIDNYEIGLVTERVLGQAVRDEWSGDYDTLAVLEHPRAG